MKAAFYETRRSVKKCIRDTNPNTDIEQEEDENIFEILENM